MSTKNTLIRPYYKKFSGFTLVELIVVITILVILGTIAFVSLAGYSKNARDGSRVSDVSNLMKTLDLYKIKTGTYPEPSNSFNITHSGVIVWTQGTFGESVFQAVGKMNKKPIDPVVGNEYTYSVTNSRTEYQIGSIYEDYSPTAFIEPAYAEGEKVHAMIQGNYNGKFIKIQIGSTMYILAVPSIITSEGTNATLETILADMTLVYSGYENLPSSYSGSNYTMTGGFDFQPGTGAVLFEGDASVLGTKAGTLAFIDKLDAFYTNSVLQSTPGYKEIIDMDTAKDQTGALALVTYYMSAKVGELVALGDLVSSGSQSSGSGTSSGSEAPPAGMAATVHGAGSFNYSYFPASLFPTSTSTAGNPQYFGNDRRWTPIEISPRKMMIISGTQPVNFGFSSVAPNGTITHLFSKELQDAVNLPAGLRGIENSYYQFDNVLNVGGGKFVVISSGKQTDSESEWGHTRYYLFQIDMDTQVLTYLNDYDLKPQQNTTSVNDYHTHLGAFLDDAGNIRVAYLKQISDDETDMEIWMQKVSISGNVFSVTEDQKILDLGNGGVFGRDAADYIYWNALTIEKVSNNKGILTLNVDIKNKGADGIRGYNPETYQDDDIVSERKILFAFGVDFSSPVYAIGGYKKLIDNTLGADYPFFSLTMGGDRVALSAVADNANREPYVVVTKLNQSTLEVTSGTPTILKNIEGYYFMGMEKMNDNSLIVAGEIDPKYTYGEAIPAGILPRQNVYAIDSISNITFPIDNGDFVYELTTKKSYRIEPDRSSLTEITNFEDPWNPGSTNSFRVSGGAFWEIDLGAANLTPVSVTETISGNLQDYSSGTDFMFRLDDARMLRLSSGQIYVNSSFRKADGTVSDHQFNIVGYPHIVLSPK